MKKNILAFLITIAAFLVILLLGCREKWCMVFDWQKNRAANDALTSQNSPGYKIRIAAPLPNDLVQGPLTVTGDAVGTWYFEATFPVRLLDANGNVIARAPAQAQGDWMTTTTVPFVAKLIFAPSTDTGTLVLEKDNPSGLPENADSVSIPVRFK